MYPTQFYISKVEIWSWCVVNAYSAYLSLPFFDAGFVKKLKTMTEAQRDGIFKDIHGLNLTKYVGECAAAIVEAKIKMTDLPLAKDVCCALHQRYAEFPSALLENWQKVCQGLNCARVIENY